MTTGARREFCGVQDFGLGPDHRIDGFRSRRVCGTIGNSPPTRSDRREKSANRCHRDQNIAQNCVCTWGCRRGGNRVRARPTQRRGHCTFAVWQSRLSSGGTDRLSNSGRLRRISRSRRQVASGDLPHTASSTADPVQSVAYKPAKSPLYCPDAISARDRRV